MKAVALIASVLVLVMTMATSAAPILHVETSKQPASATEKDATDIMVKPHHKRLTKAATASPVVKKQRPARAR